MSQKNLKIALVGSGVVGASTASEMLKRKPLVDLKTFSEPKISDGRFRGYDQPKFKTKEELNSFLADVKHIYLSRTPKMPFNHLNDYVKEYDLVIHKKSILSSCQRIHVQNIVHYHLRKGVLTLN